MDLNQLVNASIADTTGSLWPGFAPELVLCGTVFLLLIVRLFSWGKLINPCFILLAGALIALYFANPMSQLSEGNSVRYELFTGMLVYDAFTVYIRAVLLVFLILFAIFTRISGVPNRSDATDFYTLIVGATIGMCLMASANHLLMVFMAVEMASVPSYALAASIKGRKDSSEAALKYSVYGAGAAGVMLYGISLLAGLTGTCHLPTLAEQLARMVPAMSGSELTVLALGGLMVMVGLAFKLSAVPFHFWCPDVFEGASAEVNAFLSVASKAAALALLVRVAVGCSTPITHHDVPHTGVAVSATPLDSGSLMSVADTVVETVEAGADGDVAAASDPLDGVRQFIGMMVAFLSLITCTFGNLAAYGQTNIKRLFAYSTIAHAGYMMMPIPAAMALIGVDNSAAERAIAALSLYIGIYLFMNLTAFAIVAFLRNRYRSEQISDYAGLVRQSPGIVICFAIVLFSLVGLPPLAGFIGKFAVFASVWQAYQATGYGYLAFLLVVGGINTAISLFYYLRVVKVMAIDSPDDQRAPAESFPLWSISGIYTAAITAPLILLFVAWEPLHQWTLAAARHLFS